MALSRPAGLDSFCKELFPDQSLKKPRVITFYHLRPANLVEGKAQGLTCIKGSTWAQGCRSVKSSDLLGALAQVTQELKGEAVILCSESQSALLLPHTCQGCTKLAGPWGSQAPPLPSRSTHLCHQPVSTCILFILKDDVRVVVGHQDLEALRVAADFALGFATGPQSLFRHVGHKLLVLQRGQASAAGLLPSHRSPAWATALSRAQEAADQAKPKEVDQGKPAPSHLSQMPA